MVGNTWRLILALWTVLESGQSLQLYRKALTLLSFYLGETTTSVQATWHSYSMYVCTCSYYVQFVAVTRLLLTFCHLLFGRKSCRTPPVRCS